MLGVARLVLELFGLYLHLWWTWLFYNDYDIQNDMSRYALSIFQHLKDLGYIRKHKAMHPPHLVISPQSNVTSFKICTRVSYIALARASTQLRVETPTPPR
jgi:hypothetical protein